MKAIQCDAKVAQWDFPSVACCMFAINFARYPNTCIIQGN